MAREVLFYWAAIGSVAMFAHPAEAELVTRGRSREPESLEAYVELVLRLILPGVQPSR